MMLYVPVVPFLYLAMCSVAVHRFGKIFGGNNQLIRRVEFLTFVNYCIWQVNTAIACHRISMYNVYTVQMIVQLFFPSLLSSHCRISVKAEARFAFCLLIAWYNLYCMLPEIVWALYKYFNFLY